MLDESVIPFDRNGSPLAAALANGIAAGQTEFTITDLSDAFGITTRAIRYYEDQGLISPQRRGQNRLYIKRDLARLAWVLRGKRVGFSIAEIKNLLDLYDINDGREQQRLKTLELCQQRVTALAAQRADIDAVIDELQEFCATLQHLAVPKSAATQ
jgi:DNA-binding transcriptional MerR regulator